jgi:hypothetical protein
MAANGITLAPMRMVDLVSNPTPISSSKYIPPSKRVGSDGKTGLAVEKIDMTGENFPSLGAVPLRVPTWGKHIIAKPVAIAKPEESVAELKDVGEKKETLSDKIKEKLRLDAIVEVLDTKKEELDPWKMTDIQLSNAGWTPISLSSAKDIAMNGFTNEDNPYIPGFIAEADSGMSLEDYVHYKRPSEGILRPLPKKTTTPAVQYEDDSDEDELE